MKIFGGYKLNNDSIIRIVNISKTYTDATKVEVFKNANLEVRSGEFLGVFAPSGMGKTTLILLLAGIIDPESGDIYILGRNIVKMNRRERALFRRKNIGIVFQFFNLIATLNVMENILLPMELNGVDRKEAIRRAYELLDIVGLRDKAYRFPPQLSGGEQQRIALLRAVAHNPNIILADEPTGNLDEENKKVVFDLLKLINRDFGCTIIVATHDVGLASKYVTRALRIHNKRLEPY